MSDKIRDAMIALDGKWPQVKNKAPGQYLHRLANDVYISTNSCKNKETYVCSHDDWQCSPPYHRQQDLHPGASPQTPMIYGEQAVRAEAKRINEALYAKTLQPATTNKYHRQITGMDGTRTTIDIYRVLHAFPTGLPEIDHAVKKLLAPGQRGAKDRITDLREAAQSIECAIKYLEQCGNE